MLYFYLSQEYNLNKLYVDASFVTVPNELLKPISLQTLSKSDYIKKITINSNIFNNE